jgi:perosamine synthetase
VGTFGDIAAFSFFGNKTITTGEGGMVVTGDAKLDGLARRLKNQGLAADREYWHDLLGFNYRMTNISAAIGLAQLERADDLIARKRRLAETYRSKLAGLPVEVHGELPGSTHAYWMVSILTKDAADRDPLRALLANRGIETRPLFNPVHLMPMYAGGAGQHPVAEGIARRGMNLPSWPGLSPGQVDEVCGTVGDYYQHK